MFRSAEDNEAKHPEICAEVLLRFIAIMLKMKQRDKRRQLFDPLLARFRHGECKEGDCDDGWVN